VTFQGPASENSCLIKRSYLRLRAHTPQEKVYVDSIRIIIYSFQSPARRKKGDEMSLNFNQIAHCAVYNVTQQMFLRYINCKE
jgi:hypothetical protein